MCLSEVENLTNFNDYPVESHLSQQSRQERALSTPDTATDPNQRTLKKWHCGKFVKQANVSPSV